MKSPFILLNEAVSHETVDCLHIMLRQAKDGELIGIAYAAMFRRRGYIVNTAGEAHRSPTYTRGMLLALDDKLSIRTLKT